ETAMPRTLPLFVTLVLLAPDPALAQPPNHSEITALFFLPDGQSAVAACLDGRLHVYDAASGKERFAVDAHKDGCWTAALSPDGKTLASGGICTATIPGFVQGSVQSDFVRLWDPTTGKELRQHPLRGSTVAFSPDGRAFVAAGTYATGKQREGGGVTLQGGT